MDRPLAPECVAINVAASASKAAFHEIARMGHGRYSFGAPDGQPIRNVLALLVPKPATAIHFSLLKQIQRLCTHSAFRQSLDDCHDAGSVWRLFERHMVK